MIEGVQKYLPQIRENFDLLLKVMQKQLKRSIEFDFQSVHFLTFLISHNVNYHLLQNTSS